MKLAVLLLLIATLVVLSHWRPAGTEDRPRDPGLPA
jgi:hypothetical protein